MASKLTVAPTIQCASPAPEGEGSKHRAGHRVSLLSNKSFRDIAYQVKTKMSIARILKSDLPKPPKEVYCEPTYMLEPNPDNKFNVSQVEKVVTGFLSTELADTQYDAKEAPQLICHLTNSIKQRVIELNYDRYKYVCHVVLAEQQGQGLYTASRCCMDESSDVFATGKFQNGSLCVAATVYGLYFD